MQAPNTWHMMGGGGIGVILFWLLAIVLTVLVVAWLLREFSGGRDLPRRERDDRPSEARSGLGSRGDEALRIVRERYARGEIDEDEFEARKRALEADGGG